MPSNIRKENEFIERLLVDPHRFMEDINGAWDEFKCSHCGKRLTINQEHQNANTLYCNEECKRLHSSMAPIAKCAYCGKEGSDVNNECNKCHTKYCNAACKKKHRKKHKKQCERIVSDGLSTNILSSEEQQQSADTTEATHPDPDVLRRCKGNEHEGNECSLTPKLDNGYCLLCDKKFNDGRGADEYSQQIIQRHEDTKSIRNPPCKGCTIRDAKIDEYCLTCDRKYNHGGSPFKQHVKRREEEEKDMNMDACYECQKEDEEPLRKCDFCTRLYHAGCGDSSSPISALSSKELKCDVCRDDEEWEKEEKEEESPSPPSSSKVSKVNTKSNEQTLHNPNWSNRILHQAMGIEEETPPPDGAETREEEDTSSLPSSPSSSSNVNTVVDKDNRMIRLLESITIKDDDPNGAVKKAVLKMMSNAHDHHLVLSDRDQKSEEHVFKQIKQRITDKNLFKLPAPQDDCPICLQKLPYLSSRKVYMSCCGKVVCNLCDHEIRKGPARSDSTCIFCKTPMPHSDQETVKRYVERMLDDDAAGVCSLGCFYQSGTLGLPQSYAMSFRLYHWARKLGSTEACCNIADIYDRGLGVKRDYEKAWHYYELAAMGGNLVARYNLGTSEMLVGNTERALKHFVIAVRNGCVDSLNKVKIIYRDGYTTKGDYTNALQYYQAHDECNIDREDKAREAVEGLAKKLPEGVEEEDLELVKTQAGCSRRQAVKALVETDHGKSQSAPRKVEEKSGKDRPTIEADAPQQINEERRPTREEEEIIQLLINQKGGSRAEVVKFLTDKGAFEPRQPAPKPAPQHIQEELPDGVKEKDIELVISQASCSRRRAIRALLENDLNLVDAIFSLTT